MRNSVRFLRNGRIVEIDDFAPSALLLDYLRLTEHATGTKEGCSEGDCGACTVAVGRLRDGKLFYEPVNACIQVLGGLDATDVVAVEDIAGVGGELHLVQQQMVEKHGSQCGYCTPGFVTALRAIFMRMGWSIARQSMTGSRGTSVCTATGRSSMRLWKRWRLARGRHSPKRTQRKHPAFSTTRIFVCHDARFSPRRPA
jgi:xanthine dehydrogenase small subunit